MIEPIKILEYYASDKFKPVLPDRTQWRHYRFKTVEHGWKKVPHTIKYEDDLKRWIQKLGGLDIFYGVSKWMNPTKISAKGLGGTYYVADNLVLGNDFVFDIDADTPITYKTLNSARKCASNIYEQMKQHSEFKLDHIAFTGCKGFRLVYTKENELPVKPKDRLDFINQNRKTFIAQVLQEIKENTHGIKFYKTDALPDIEVTANPMTVIRVLGTAHSKTGYITTAIAPGLLRKPMDQLITHIPFIGTERPGIPSGEMTLDGGAKPSSVSVLEQLGKDVSGLASFPPSPDVRYFITNRVSGVKRGFVPIFIYVKEQVYFENELVRLQQRYNLGSIYVFDMPKHYVAISLKTMQRRQLQKVLNESSSKTKHDFRKFKRIFAPFRMGFSKKLKGKYTGHLSRGHLAYVNPMEPAIGDFCGWDKIELIKAIK